MPLTCRLSSSMVRHFPSTPIRRQAAPALDVARGERHSFQVALREAGDRPVDLTVEAEAPEGWGVRVRRVGYVPVRHHNTDMPEDEVDGPGCLPGYAPDPLFDEATLRLPPRETHAFWFTVTPPPDARPGNHSIRVRVLPKDAPPIPLTMTVRVHDVTVRPRRDFHVTNWFYNDALLDFYRCTAFDARYWQVLPGYLRNMVEHGQDTLYAPVFTPPLDGVKRPSQLLRVRRTGRDRYAFDWRDVKQYVDLANRAGIEKFEWTHLFTQWGVRHAIRIYEGQGVDEKLLWPAETPADSDTYRRFLAQFLPRFHRFLTEERILDRSFFHVSDEPHDDHVENYSRARALLKELAPWMSVMDAISNIRFGREKLTDMPAPIINHAPEFVAEGIPCWCYYCCGPRGRYLNRLIDNPLPKIRMNGWLFYRWPFKGFLHWGYNYWYESQTRKMIDPFTVQDGLRWPSWAYGDPFVVYPGPEGPIDSLRWELFAESLQDYALLQTVGQDRASRLLAPLKSFCDFPKTEKWIRDTRRKLLTRESDHG